MHRSGASSFCEEYGLLSLGPRRRLQCRENDRACAGPSPTACLRTCLPGHLTGSAWILSPDRGQDAPHPSRQARQVAPAWRATPTATATSLQLRSARHARRAGSTRFTVVDRRLFDVDRHWIPGPRNGAGPLAPRFEVRCSRPTPPRPLIVTSESKDLRGSTSRVPSLNPEESMARMVRKTWPGRPPRPYRSPLGYPGPAKGEVPNPKARLHSVGDCQR